MHKNNRKPEMKAQYNPQIANGYTNAATHSTLWSTQIHVTFQQDNAQAHSLVYFDDMLSIAPGP